MMAVGDLAAHVYGPYSDEIFLRDSPPPKSGNSDRLPLYDVELYCGSERIGFDQSEYITSPPANPPVPRNATVMFFGILEIEDLGWITKTGLEYLERDIKEYDQQVHIRYLTGDPGWDIHRFWRQLKTERRSLKVRIGCVKNMLAHYLTSDRDPEKLLVYSRNQTIHRKYWVKSLNVQTYKKSQQFINRYRLRALIIELSENDPDATPIHKRNIDYLIERYIADIRPRDSDGDRRIIPAVNLASFIASEPRHLRHVSRSEIRSRFAEQAEWLLANQIASNSQNSKLVDIPQWISFCKESWQDSLDAHANGVKWGSGRSRILATETRNAYDLPRRLAEYGQTPEFWANQLKNVKQQEARAGKKKRVQTLPYEGLDILKDVPPAQPLFQYDSDFSEATTVDSSDSESALGRPTLAINARIPRFLHEVPKIRSAHFTWYCQGCDHVISLLDLPPDCLALLSPETAHVIKHTRSWKVNDTPIQEALYLMVEKHYTERHLIPNNIQFTTKNQNVYLQVENNKDSPQVQLNGHVKMEDTL